MNKTELVAVLARKTGLTKKDTEATINAFIDTVQEELQNKDGKVQLIGFGTFEVRDRKSRIGRNPLKPQETVEIPSGKAPVFHPGKAFKDAVNK